MLRRASGAKAENLTAERMDTPDLADEVGVRSVAVGIADTCRDLEIAAVSGYGPGSSAHRPRWQRYAPAPETPMPKGGLSHLQV